MLRPPAGDILTTIARHGPTRISIWKRNRQPDRRHRPVPAGARVSVSGRDARGARSRPRGARGHPCRLGERYGPARRAKPSDPLGRQDHPHRCLRRRAQAAAGPAGVAPAQRHQLHGPSGGGRMHAGRHRYRDVHPPSCRSRRLEHPPRLRPLGSDVLESALPHQPDRNRPSRQGGRGKARGQSRQLPGQRPAGDRARPGDHREGWRRVRVRRADSPAARPRARPDRSGSGFSLSPATLPAGSAWS